MPACFVVSSSSSSSHPYISTHSPSFPHLVIALSNIKSHHHGFNPPCSPCTECSTPLLSIQKNLYHPTIQQRLKSSSVRKSASRSFASSFQSHHINMSEGDGGLRKPTASAYEEALDAMSSLITKRGRVTQNRDRFDLLFHYVKMLELEDSISQMKIIHVAGTKGKGSTCTFTESILRNCGFHTGLFTSPHLIDVRERFRLDGTDICEEKFLTYFWWCWNRLKEKTNKDIPMPTLFHFLALLAFKIFAAEQVDVAILEVGLGGKFDATNLVQTSIVCGITSLGYDHMEILGHTLAEIAREKAGIFKCRVPAFTVSQPDEAMRVLEETASNLDVHLQAVPSLNANLLNGLRLALDGLFAGAVHQGANNS